MDKTACIEKFVYGRMSELLCTQCGWTDEQRVNVLSRYMVVSGSNNIHHPIC